MMHALPRSPILGSLALLLSLLAGCTAEPENQAAPTSAEPRPLARLLTGPDARDSRSFARPEIARVTHLALDLELDFERRRVSGLAVLDIAAAQGASELILDSNGLSVEWIEDPEGRPLAFAVGAGDEARGRPLTVRIGAARRIAIRYAAAPEAQALQWLAPAQTAGKRHPYLFSQGQSTLNRSWIPTQDSPGIRQTWEARISAPEALKVVMSGERLTRTGEPAGPGRLAWRFRMDRPVAPYLIAIAAGDLAFRPLGPRTGIWSEPATLAAAAREFADVERMMDAAERLYGAYRWGRYDMIVLPPAFPYGGMENPTLTFLTPTLIAGDRSLVATVAHELAHSWSGNLVTNAVWRDGWLNEGFTSYFENRIMELVFGRARAAQEAALSWGDMEETFAEVGRDSPATRLHAASDDPDDGQTGIVYDKGAIFLRTLERIAGRERFDRWLRGYFDRHAFQPMTSALLVADLRRHLVAGDIALERRLSIDEWVYAPGLPSNAARPDPAAFARVDAATRAFAGGGAAAGIGWGDYNTAERIRFLESLQRDQPRERLAELDRALGLSASGNSEVLFAWLQLALANRFDPALPATERFLLAMGRRKFVAPLFETLFGEGEWGRPIAERLYRRARPLYHPVTTGTVDQTMAAR